MVTPQLTIRIPNDVREELQKIADATDRSLGYVINLACVAYIETHKAPGKARK